MQSNEYKNSNPIPQMTQESKFPLYHWHLEISAKCTLQCPRCPRTEMKGHYRPGEIPFEDIQRIFSEKLFVENALKITLCGGQGDPIYHSQFLEVVKFFKSQKPNKILTIITNGSHKKPSWWKELKSLLTPGDEITFSIDGFDNESNNLYRKNSNWDSIMAGAKEVIGGDALVFWNAIVFKFNENKMDHMKSMAEALGFDGFKITHSPLFGSRFEKYLDPKLGHDPLEPTGDGGSKNWRSHRNSVSFSEDSSRVKAFHSAFKEFRNVRNQLANEVYQKYSHTEFLPNCSFGFRGNYIDADGIFYPCSWVSHPKPKEAPNSYKSILMQTRDKFDLHKRSLTEVLCDPFWDQLTNTWKSKDMALSNCLTKCRKVDFPKENLVKYKITNPHLESQQ